MGEIMILSNDEKTQYLANILGLIHADGKITPQEESTLPLAQKTIAARKTELTRAYKLFDTNSFTPTPVGLWSDKIKNLEFIIYASLIDGELSRDEKKYILSFAKQINISQEQLNFIVTDIKKSIQQTPQEINCSKCNAKISSTTKFCPECGQAVNETIANNTVAVSYAIPSNGISIEFAESSSGSFPLILELWQKAPISKECLKAKKKWYLASWPTTDPSEAIEIAENLKSLKNKRVFVEGQEKTWNEIFGFSWCALSRKSAYRPQQYCFGVDEKRLNIWGCRQAGMDWAHWADWFSYGSFKKAGILSKNNVFEFDKARIRHELENN